MESDSPSKPPDPDSVSPHVVRRLTRRRFLELSALGGASLAAAGAFGPLAAAAPSRSSAKVRVDAGAELGASAVRELAGAIVSAPWEFDTVDGLPLSEQAIYARNAWRGGVLTSARGPIVWTSALVTITTLIPLTLDFTKLDRYTAGVTGSGPNDLGSESLFTLGDTPLELSSNPADPNYWAWAPADYDLWEEFMRQVAARILTHSSNVKFQLWSEPENELWLGRFRLGHTNTAAEQLRDYVEWCYHTQRAVKAVFPDALIGAPASAHYNSGPTGLGFTKWSLPEFYDELKLWNTENPAKAWEPDAADWHDYWTETLDVGRELVKSSIAAKGFAAPSELWVSEYNTSWGSAPDCIQPPEHRAAFLVRNVIRELNPGGPRGLTRAIWYGADDVEFECQGASLWIVPGNYLGYEYTGGYCKRQQYAALQALDRLAVGNYVSSSISTAGEPIEVMAVKNATESLALIIASRAGSSFTGRVHYEHLPSEWQTVTLRTQRVDSTFSADCNGLEDGVLSQHRVRNGRLVIPDVSLPANSIRLLTLTP